MKNAKNWKGLLYGIAYGLLARGVFGLESDYLQSYIHAGGLMTFCTGLDRSPKSQEKLLYGCFLSA